MVYLVTEGRAAGLAQLEEVRSVYASLEEAQMQAEHDATQGRHPLRIEDTETGEVLWTVQDTQ